MAGSMVLVVFDEMEKIEGPLKARFPDVEFLFCATPDQVEPALAQKPEIAFCINYTGFPRALHKTISATSSLKWLHVGGSGYEQYLPFNNPALTITNATGVLARFLAETTMGALLMLNGHFLDYRAQQQRAEWQGILFEPLYGKTLLVVGAGAIGGHVCRLAKTFGMTVLAVRGSGAPVEHADEVHRPTALLDLLARADAVTLHVRLTEETRHMINDAAFDVMRPSAFLLNTSRGAVVEELALIRALDEGKIAGAYLDVFEQEPLPADSPLWTQEKLFITPHSSDGVSDWAQRFAGFFGDNLERWLKGEALVNLVKTPDAAD